MYSVKELYNGVYKRIGIPIVFDYHHHRFCDGGLVNKEALGDDYINQTKTLYQLSTIVRVVVRNDLTSQLDLKHSDYVYDYIDNYGHDIDIMVERNIKNLWFKDIRSYIHDRDNNIRYFLVPLIFILIL